jgi:hypothetical protein
LEWIFWVPLAKFFQKFHWSYFDKYGENFHCFTNNFCMKLNLAYFSDHLCAMGVFNILSIQNTCVRHCVQVQVLVICVITVHFKKRKELFADSVTCYTCYVLFVPCGSFVLPEIMVRVIYPAYWIAPDSELVLQSAPLFSFSIVRHRESSSWIVTSPHHWTVRCISIVNGAVVQIIAVVQQFKSVFLIAVVIV